MAARLISLSLVRKSGIVLSYYSNTLRFFSREREGGRKEWKEKVYSATINLADLLCIHPVPR